MGEVAREGADVFGKGLAGRVQQPFVMIVCEQVDKRRRREDARRTQGDVGGGARRGSTPRFSATKRQRRSRSASSRPVFSKPQP